LGEVGREHSNDRLDDILVGAIRALHMDIGFRIGLPLHARELLQRAFRISGLE
jgi:hypothetical protein